MRGEGVTTALEGVAFSASSGSGLMGVFELRGVKYVEGESGSGSMVGLVLMVSWC